MRITNKYIVYSFTYPTSGDRIRLTQHNVIMFERSNIQEVTHLHAEITD